MLRFTHLVSAAFAASLLFSAGHAFGEASPQGCASSGGNAAGCTTNNGGAGGAGGNGGNGGQGGQGGSANVHNSNSNVNVNSNSAKSSARQSQGQVQGQGQSQSYEGYSGASVNVEAKAYADPPTVFAPPMVAAPETCMGSVSASLSGGNGIVGAGVGFGKTYESESCNRRMFARALSALGQNAAALSLLAQDPMVRQALEAAGVKVAIEAPKPIVAPVAAAQEVKASPIADRDAARLQWDRERAGLTSVQSN